MGNKLTKCYPDQLKHIKRYLITNIVIMRLYIIILNTISCQFVPCQGEGRGSDSCLALNEKECPILKDGAFFLLSTYVRKIPECS